MIVSKLNGWENGLGCNVYVHYNVTALCNQTETICRSARNSFKKQIAHEYLCLFEIFTLPICVYFTNQFSIPHLLLLLPSFSLFGVAVVNEPSSCIIPPIFLPRLYSPFINFRKVFHALRLLPPPISLYSRVSQLVPSFSTCYRGQPFITLDTGVGYNWEGIRAFQRIVNSMKLSWKFSIIVVCNLVLISQ